MYWDKYLIILAKKSWVVVKSLTKGVSLIVGDSIKIGRVKLKVIEYGRNSYVRESNSSLNENQEKICHICLSSINKVENPLIKPCGCSGTMEFVHLECLQ